MTDDEAARVERLCRRAQVRKWVWWLTIPPFVAAYFVLPREAFVEVSLLGIGAVTLFTQGTTESSIESGERSRLASLRDEGNA
jgi:hypothetical protein